MINEEAIVLSRLLLVEGMDDMYFLDEFIRQRGIADVIQIRDFKGKSKLAEFVDSLNKDQGFKENVTTLAVIRDADANAEGALNSVRAALAKLDALTRTISHGLFVQGTKMKFGTYIMPDGHSPGMLETLCCNSINHVPEYLCLDNLVQCLQRTGRALIPDKLRTRSYLYSFANPDCRLGIALKKKKLDALHEAFNPLADFLRSM